MGHESCLRLGPPVVMVASLRGSKSLFKIYWEHVSKRNHKLFAEIPYHRMRRTMIYLGSGGSAEGDLQESAANLVSETSWGADRDKDKESAESMLP